MSQPSVALGDIFTDDQFQKLRDVYVSQTSQGNSPHDAIVKAMQPMWEGVLVKLYNKTRQKEHDLHYFAYAVEAAFAKHL